MTTTSRSQTVHTTPSGSEWDAFVASHPHGTLHQTSAWGRVKDDGHDALRVVVRDESGSIVAGAQLLSRRLIRYVGAGYVPYGPIADSVDQAARVLEALEDASRRAGLSALLIQPPRHAPELEALLIGAGYAQSGIDIATSATVEIDVTRPLDVLRAELTKDKRKQLRHAERAGVVVRNGTHDDLATFHRLHALSAERHGFLPMSLDYLERQWTELGPSGNVRLMVAEIDGRPVGAKLFTVFNGLGDLKLTGLDLSDRTRRAGVGHALQWAILEWAHLSGVSVFDLGGMARSMGETLVASEGRAEVDDTGTRFKLGWGGAVSLFPPTYEKVIHPIGQLTYRLPAAVLADDGLGGRIVNWLRQR